MLKYMCIMTVDVFKEYILKKKNKELWFGMFI